MDYKKKYEEALKMARIYRDNDIVRDMPYMETELRAHGLTVEKTLAYLEKQKESLRDFIDDFPYSDVQKEQKPDTFNEPYNPDEYDVVMEGNAISLKRKEQKPYGQRDECKDCQANYAGSCKGTCEMKHPDGCFTCDEYKKGYEAGRSNGFTAGFNKAMKEQKPLTDDLDQEVHRFFEECITVHDAKIYGVEERVIPVDCYEVTARHFASWQKKQDYAEWSEEDEKILHGIEQCVYDNVANIGTVNKVKYIDFLESLRYDKKEIPMPDSTKLLEMWKDVEKMLKDKSENDPNWETWRIAYNAFLSGFGKGLMVKQQ